jgi:pimeloyl-ACP methyl ester carboxylesterase
MLIYISGPNSTERDWIDLKLKVFTNNNYSYYLVDDDINDILDDTVIIAHSLGCLRAMQLWNKLPDKIKSIHLINPSNQIFDFKFNFKNAPVTIHLGSNDEVLNMSKLSKNIKLNYIKLITYKDLSHRFDQIQFDEILKNIKTFLHEF